MGNTTHISISENEIHEIRNEAATEVEAESEGEATMTNDDEHASSSITT